MPSKLALKNEVKKTMSIPTSISDVKRHVKSNINEAKAKEAKTHKENKEEEVKGISKAIPFDKGKVEALLEEIVVEFKKKNRLLESTMLKQPIEIEDDRITFFMSGELQEERFNKFKPELVGILKKKLQNDQVEILCEVKEEAVSRVKKLYTSTDKLAYLAEKSPALKELQKRFGLETDF